MSLALVSTILSYIMGPVGALVICVVLLYGIYHFVDSKVLPLLSAWVDRHLSQVDKIISNHESDMKAIRDSLHENTRAIVVLSEQVDFLSDEIKNLKTPIERG